MTDHALRNVPDNDLRAMAEDCTELSCPYHGPVNWELMKRGVPRYAPKDDDGQPD